MMSMVPVAIFVNFKVYNQTLNIITLKGRGSYM